MSFAMGPQTTFSFHVPMVIYSVFTRKFLNRFKIQKNGLLGIFNNFSISSRTLKEVVFVNNSTYLVCFAGTDSNKHLFNSSAFFQTNKDIMNSTSKIYQGHVRRYERWCINEKLDPSESHTLNNYKIFLKENKKLSDNYIKSVIWAIVKKWFGGSDGTSSSMGSRITNRKKDNMIDGEEREGKTENKTKRMDRLFSMEDLLKIYNGCFQLFETDETALLILIILCNPDFRPGKVMRILNTENNSDERLTLIQDTDEKTRKLKEFIMTGLSKYPGKVFPRKHTTYLCRVKKHISKLLGREYPNSTFEMLSRSLFSLKFRRKWRVANTDIMKSIQERLSVD